MGSSLRAAGMSGLGLLLLLAVYNAGRASVPSESHVSHQLRLGANGLVAMGANVPCREGTTLGLPRAVATRVSGAATAVEEPVWRPPIPPTPAPAPAAQADRESAAQTQEKDGSGEAESGDGFRLLPVPDSATDILRAMDDGIVYEERLRALRRTAERNVLDKRALIYFLHLQKTGGSTMCHSAEMNRMRTTRDHNCNLWDHERGKQSEFMNWTPEGQLALFNERRLSFVANEGSLGDSPPPPGPVIYAVAVRDPLDRVLSQYMHKQQDGSALPGDSFEGFLDHYKERGALPPRWVANFQTRMLAPGVPKDDDVLESDLAAAVRRLQHLFSVVMITDDFSRTAGLLRSKLGWKRTDVDGRQRAGTTRNSNARSTLRHRPDLIQYLERLNAHDLVLVARARVVADERLREGDAGPAEAARTHLRPQPQSQRVRVAGTPELLKRMSAYPQCIGKLRWYCNSYYDLCGGSEAEMRERQQRAYDSVMSEGEGKCPTVEGAFFVHPLFS